MYGLINNALKAMILEKFDEQVWHSILNESGVPSDSFITMRSYGDDVTYALVGAASKVLEAPAETCLEMFGYYWITKAAPNSYGDVLDVMGDDAITFLESIDAMHDRITTTFLNYIPPSFRVKRLDDGNIKVQYISERQGLTSFVEGIFRALSERFDCRVDIVSKHTQQDENGEITDFILTVK